MTFFDERGKVIQCPGWVATYEPYYFLGGPTFGKRINARNQSSRFVENKVCSLLTKTSLLSREDLVLLMAWKIGGLIDHRRSEPQKTILYLHDWPATLIESRYRKDFSQGICYLAANIDAISERVHQGDPRYLFDLHLGLRNFGAVYILTVLFFISRGIYPIYDRYADVGGRAIASDSRPGSFVKYSGLQKWEQYQQYVRLLSAISKSAPQDAVDPSMCISRPVDRALWVYGHFFKTE